MKTVYLKKSKFYYLVLYLFNDCLDIKQLAKYVKMKDCTYRFYRGTEWLEFYVFGSFYHISRLGNYILVDVSYYDENNLDVPVINRFTYRIDVNKFIATSILVYFEK